MMGYPNPNPHGLIRATEAIPSIPAVVCASHVAFMTTHERDMLGHYLAWEIAQDERIVARIDDWVCLAPHWAAWPVETMLLPRTSVSSISELSADAKKN